ncbi:MAG: class I SAM-dependent methyltransferase, partial [Chlamydiae bacterium]|nr:class I SAM-dependent methyltransferase [Chlamydiota bacterium]
MKIKERATCRISGGELIDLLDLGNLPVSCFPRPHDPSPEVQPLQLCLNKDSGLVQLKHTVDPDEIYHQYWYMSGINQSMKVALHSIVEQAIKRSLKPLAKNDIVVDIASNDGTLLAAYPNTIFRIGIDPAKNIKPQACDLHINTYFSGEVYKRHLGEKKVSIITSIAVFYDLEDPIIFAQGVAEILKEDGLWIMEMSYLPTMLKNNAFETICAEHIEYYSLTSIEYILDRVDLKVEDVELNDVNGGSFRLYIRHKKATRESNAVKKMREEEKKMNLCEPRIYERFAQNIQKNKQEMVAFLEKQK